MKTILIFSTKQFNLKGQILLVNFNFLLKSVILRFKKLYKKDTDIADSFQDNDGKMG